jgi:hypothetical protein
MIWWKLQLTYGGLMMSLSRVVLSFHPIGQLIFYHGIRHTIAGGVKRSRKQLGIKNS